MSSDEAFRERMIQMAMNLLDATREAKISWALTDIETQFIYAGSRSSVTIALHSDRYNDDTTILSLLNQRGTTVDSLETEYRQVDDGRMIPSPWNDVLVELYHAARRVAYNVDEALASMMSDIERGTPSPPPPPKKADPWGDEPPF